jgi:hypothetical protein
MISTAVPHSKDELRRLRPLATASGNEPVYSWQDLRCDAEKCRNPDARTLRPLVSVGTNASC